LPGPARPEIIMRCSRPPKSGAGPRAGRNRCCARSIGAKSRLPPSAHRSKTRARPRKP
jgi:hypothetical protein